MKTIPSLRKYRYVARVSIFLTTVALIAGIVGCADRPAVNAIEIRDWYDLAAISNNTTANYILMNDLDATTDGWEELASPTSNEGKGWKPIAAIDKDPEFAYFRGVFDGRGHEINDLFINRPGEHRVGLFRYTNLLGVIKNIGVVNANVTGDERVGGLVGQVARSTVRNSYFTGTVTGNHIVGGLVGGIWIGGIVSGSYAIGTVTGGLNATGGLTGYSSTGCNVSLCYFDGDVIGDSEVGGLVGWNYESAISNSYSTGSVTGHTRVGGLVGANTGTVSNSYSVGNVNGDLEVGGLVAYSGGIVSNSFWDTETSGQAASDGGTGKHMTEMKDISTFMDTETEGLHEPWDIVEVINSSARNTDYVWNIVDDVTYPFLSWQPVS